MRTSGLDKAQAILSLTLAPPTQHFFLGYTGFIREDPFNLQQVPGLNAAHMQKRSPLRPRPATASGHALSPVDLPPTSTSHFSTPQDLEHPKHRFVSMGSPTAWIGSPQALPVCPVSPCPPAMPPFLRSDFDPRVVTHHTSHLLTSISGSTHVLYMYIPYTQMPRPLHPHHLQRVQILPPLTIKVFIISKKK